MKKLGKFKEEGSLISVKMYDYASYMSLFDSKIYSDVVKTEKSK